MSIVHVHPIEDGKRFACYLNDECVSLSKNADYLETHYKEGDVKWLNGLVIEKFVYYDNNGQIIKESNAVRGVPVQLKIEDQPYLHYLHPGISKLSIEPLTENGSLDCLKNNKQNEKKLTYAEKIECEKKFKNLRVHNTLEQCIVELMNFFHTSRNVIYNVISKLPEF